MKLCALTSLLLLLLCGGYASDAVSSSRFENLVFALQNEPDSLNDVFAQTALTILMEIYLAEADLARREEEESGGSGKLASWALAVDQYSQQINMMLDQIEVGSPVEVRSTSNTLGIIAIAGRSIILSHPRADQQSAFEYRIVSDFCAQTSCKKLFEQLTSPTPVPVSAPVVTPNWSFAAEGPVCSSSAISIQFSSAKDLANYRGLCRQFFQEITSLATEIRWQESQGVKTDWPSIAIRQTPHKPEHIVALTSSGDVTLLPLPLLYSSEGLLSVLLPWLQAQLSGIENPVLVINAATYGWN